MKYFTTEKVKSAEDYLLEIQAMLSGFYRRRMSNPPRKIEILKESYQLIAAYPGSTTAGIGDKKGITLFGVRVVVIYEYGEWDLYEVKRGWRIIF